MSEPTISGILSLPEPDAPGAITANDILTWISGNFSNDVWVKYRLGDTSWWRAPEFSERSQGLKLNFHQRIRLVNMMESEAILLELAHPGILKRKPHTQMIEMPDEMGKALFG